MVDKTLLIVASRWDSVAQSCVAYYSNDGVSLLTPEDLSVTGWHHSMNKRSPSQAVASRRLLEVSKISGVLTRLPWVSEQELPHIIASDRPYVAAEMNAFLLSWLTELKCSVWNRPTPTCLCGPFWRQEKWIHTATKLKIPTHPINRRAALSGNSSINRIEQPISVVTVVGDYIVGDVHGTLISQAQLLAQIAGVELLTVYFDSPEAGAYFIGADLYPDLTKEDVANAVFTQLHKTLKLYS